MPFAKEPDEKDLDVVEVEEDDSEKKKRKREKKEYKFIFDKDSPSFDLSDEEAVDTKEILQNLSHDELRELLEEALERIKDGTVSDDKEVGDAIAKTTLAVDVLIVTTNEMGAWLPAGVLAKITESAAFAVLKTVGIIVLPLIGWVVLTIEFRTATEKHRAWGMRTALRESSFALRRLSRDFNIGPTPRRPIQNWIISSKDAAIKELKKSGLNLPIHWKFHEGYNFVVKELTSLINDVLDEAEKVVYKEFASIGLSNAKIKIVLESGLVDINRVYGKAMLGLSNFLIEELRKIEKN